MFLLDGSIQTLVFIPVAFAVGGFARDTVSFARFAVLTLGLYAAVDALLFVAELFGEHGTPAGLLAADVIRAWPLGLLAMALGLGCRILVVGPRPPPAGTVVGSEVSGAFD